MLHSHDLNHVQGGQRTGLVDADVQDLTLRALLVGEEELAVDFLCELELVKELYMISESSPNKLSDVYTFSDSVFAMS